MTTPAKIELENLPTIALVGRVNVGKSTLFNRLIEKNQAIVSKIPGTTRTSNEGVVLWRGKYIKLVDTGGLTFTDNVPLEEDILKQTEKAVKDADVILFIADAKDGILPQERELAKRLRRVEIKPVLFVANKVDSKKLEYNITEPEWSRLGLGEPIPISAASGRKIGDFLDILFKTLNKTKRRPKKNISERDELINVSIIGKPNVGKSSLFNKIIGQEKVIVSDMPHTTREPHDTLITYIHNRKKHKINFIDTAGIRRKAKVRGHLEKQGIHKSIESIEDSDIILFVVDGNDTISSQDRQLGGLLEKRSKSIIIIVNKWDLAEDNSDHARNEAKKLIYANFPHLDFAPIVFTSGLTGYKVHDIFPLILQAAQARQTEIPNKILDDFIQQASRGHKPARGKGTRHPKIIGMRQLNTDPPIFEMMIKYRTSLHRSYVNYVENRLREQFNFFATPIVIKLSKMKR